MILFLKSWEENEWVLQEATFERSIAKIQNCAVPLHHIICTLPLQQKIENWFSHVWNVSSDQSVHQNRVFSLASIFCETCLLTKNSNPGVSPPGTNWRFVITQNFFSWQRITETAHHIINRNLQPQFVIDQSDTGTPQQLQNIWEQATQY